MNNDQVFILIVEDSEDDYDAMIRAFHDAGLTNPFFRCRGGREVLDFLNHEGAFQAPGSATKPGLILLDLNMPGIDGRKVLQFIKGDARFRSIPVIILTTSSSAQDVAACYEAGASAYMQKPVRYDELVDAIRRLKDFWFHAVTFAKDGQGAGAGKAEISYNRGWKYQVGYGVKQDPVLAYMWYSLAAAAGNADAAARLGDLAREMTKEQVAEARRLAEERKDEKK